MNEEAKIQALKWHIKALQGHIKELNETIENQDKVIKALEQELCEDVISRQAVLDHIYGINGLEGLELSNVFEKHYADFIKSLPSVNPQPKTGHWIEKDVVLQEDNAIEEWQSARCDKCGKYHTTPFMYYFSHYEYCPNCGAKMVGSQESEET